MSNTLLSKHLGDLSIIEVGYEECKPGHHYATAFTDRYLMHYIISGKGILKVDDKEYHLKEGNAFLIGEHFAYYEADQKEPWTYVWIHFSGDIARSFIQNIGLSYLNPIYETSNSKKITECFQSILRLQEFPNDFIAYSYFFKLFGEMQITNKTFSIIKNEASYGYVEKCEQYIEANYYKKISVSDICQFIGLEYSYLFRLFQQQLKISPGKYLSNYRLYMAEQLIRTTDMPIIDISQSVGYEDRFVFSKAFRLKYGLSPSKYRLNYKLKGNCLP